MTIQCVQDYTVSTQHQIQFWNAHPPNHTQCFAQPFERLSLDFRAYYIIVLHIFLIGQFPRVSLLFGYPKLVVKQAKSPTSSVTTYIQQGIEDWQGRLLLQQYIQFLKAAAAAVTHHHQQQQQPEQLSAPLAFFSKSIRPCRGCVVVEEEGAFTLVCSNLQPLPPTKKGQTTLLYTSMRVPESPLGLENCKWQLQWSTQEKSITQITSN